MYLSWLIVILLGFSKLHRHQFDREKTVFLKSLFQEDNVFSSFLVAVCFPAFRQMLLGNFIHKCDSSHFLHSTRHLTRLHDPVQRLYKYPFYHHNFAMAIADFQKDWTLKLYVTDYNLANLNHYFHLHVCASMCSFVVSVTL